VRCEEACRPMSGRQRARSSGVSHTPLVQVDWGAVAAVGTVLLVVFGVVGGIYRVVTRRRDRRTASGPAEDVALAGVVWHFMFLLQPVAGTELPQRAPVVIRVVGASVWVHAVHLSWGVNTPGFEWVTDDVPCPPWPGGDTLPVQLYPTSRSLDLSWPGPDPAAQVQLRTRLRVLYSVTREGPPLWREVDGGTVQWQ
jgi:hypothetical protein